VKCHHCGGLSKSFFCSDSCYDLGMAELYGAWVETGKRTNILCNDLMFNNKVLCHNCTQRLDRLMTSRCNKHYERIKNVQKEV